MSPPHAICEALGCGDEPGESASGFDWVCLLVTGIVDGCVVGKCADEAGKCGETY